MCQLLIGVTRLRYFALVTWFDVQLWFPEIKCIDAFADFHNYFNHYINHNACKFSDFFSFFAHKTLPGKNTGLN